MLCSGNPKERRNRKQREEWVWGLGLRVYEFLWEPPKTGLPKFDWATGGGKGGGEREGEGGGGEEGWSTAHARL